MLKRLLKEQEGQTLVEYALLVAMIAIACVFVVYTLGKRLELAYDHIQKCLGLNLGGPSKASVVVVNEPIPVATSENPPIAIFGQAPDLQAP
jgi:Flp pilus assembly pilin Flp